MSKKKRIGCAVLALSVVALSLAVCVPCPVPSSPLAPPIADGAPGVGPIPDAAMCAEPDSEPDAFEPRVDAAPPDADPPYCFAHKKEAKAFCALAAKVCDP